MFSEDGGIKTLMVKQYQKGDFQSTLSLNAPDWVVDLWGQGLYPFRKPFVYDLPQGKTVVFPPLFQIISTPFYWIFGFRGLYIIPALATFILWILFVKLCRTLNFTDRVVQLSLLALVFSSSLTLYSAIFWEHTLTSLLCLCGLFYLIQANTENANRKRTTALLFGLATGLSLWLRPEALIILTALLAWSVYWIVNAKMRFIQFFVYGIVLSIIGFLIFNFQLFENPLGLRSKQIVDRFDIVQRLKDGGYIFIVLCVKTLLFDPISLLIILYVLLRVKNLYKSIKTVRAISTIHLTMLSIGLFYISAPWLLPNTGGNNWGIRYALVCTPFIYVVAASFGNQVMLSYPKRKAIIAGIFVLIAAGMVKNSILGSRMLYENYNGPKSRVLDYLIKEKPAVILITKSYHAGELESLMPQSVFMLTDKKESIQRFLNTPESKSSHTILVYDTNNTYSDFPLKESDLHDFVLQDSFRNFKLYKYRTD